MDINFADFVKDLQDLRWRYPKGFEMAMKATMTRVGEVANEQKPKPPIDEGNLRRSLSFFYSDGTKEIGPDAMTSLIPMEIDEQDDPYKVYGIIAYLVPYAFYLHENPNWWPNEASDRREPGMIGSHWLSTALETSDEEWNNLLAEFLEDYIQ